FSLSLSLSLSLSISLFLSLPLSFSPSLSLSLSHTQKQPHFFLSFIPLPSHHLPQSSCCSYTCSTGPLSNIPHLALTLAPSLSPSLSLYLLLPPNQSALLAFHSHLMSCTLA